MHPRLYSAETEQFADVASNFCALLESAAHSSSAKLLPALDRALPFLYHAAAGLPDIEPDTSEYAQIPVPQDEINLVQSSLSKLFGRWDAYSEMYNPSDATDRKPVGYLLSLDLAEIYQDLRESLTLAESRSASTNDVLWEWRFSFSSHWGHHAASAIRVLNALVHTEYAHVPAESD